MKKKISSTIEEEENQVEKWLDETDLAESITSGVRIDLSKKAGRPQIGEKISVTIPPVLIEKIKEAALKRHIGYQTMLRIILAENVQKY